MQEVLASLHEKLQPIEGVSYLKLLGEKVTEKRESALEEIRSWLGADSTDTNILLLLGDAWSGKSVFFACTVDELKRDPATAIFVCDYSDLDRSDARRVITTLASQIAKFVGGSIGFAAVAFDESGDIEEVVKKVIQKKDYNDEEAIGVSKQLLHLYEAIFDDMRERVGEFEKMLALILCTREPLSKNDLASLTDLKLAFDEIPRFEWRKNLVSFSDLIGVWAETFNLDIDAAERVLFQGCVDAMVKNRPLLGGQEARIVMGLQDLPVGVSKVVAYACQHWFSHFKATAGNLPSSPDLGEFLAADSFGPGLLVRGVRDGDEGVIRLAFTCSHGGQPERSETEKEKNRQLLFAAEAAKLLPSPLLHEAAKRNRVDICRMLLDCGSADVNAVGPPPAFGTALHSAARARADDVFGLLLDKGVDLLARDADRRTASDLYPEYFEMLERKSKRKEVLQVQQDQERMNCVRGFHGVIVFRTNQHHPEERPCAFLDKNQKYVTLPLWPLTYQWSGFRFVASGSVMDGHHWDPTALSRFIGINRQECRVVAHYQFPTKFYFYTINAVDDYETAHSAFEALLLDQIMDLDVTTLPTRREKLRSTFTRIRLTEISGTELALGGDFSGPLSRMPCATVDFEIPEVCFDLARINEEVRHDSALSVIVLFHFHGSFLASKH
ncbi:hypothetical protein HK405_010166 [Cladochytrium tenue]|nr:hypothetical protein HK405_010166 [Cladochytrium tenue]